MTTAHPPRSPRPPRPSAAGAAIGTLLSLACVHTGDRLAPAPTAAASAPVAPATPASSVPTPDARIAVQRALTFLQKDGDWWMAGGKSVPGGGGCVSCHVVTFALWSHHEAERAAIPFERAPLEQLEQKAHRFFADKPSKIEPVPSSQLLLGRAYPTDSKDGSGPRWTAIQHQLLDDQEKEGHWEAGGQFPTQKRPSPESDAVATMWTLIAFGSFQRLDPQVAASRDRAFTWLKKSPPGVSNEWLATRLLVERQLGEPDNAQSLLDRLLREQHADGGWSWLARDPSNGYSTGQTLYALAAAGLDDGHPAVRRAVGFLLSTQNQDGTWTTPSRLTSNKGEEGGKIEYIYKYWGTAWAAIGLARTLSTAPVAAR